MVILLTNDDGFFASGLLVTKKALEKYGKVYVIAPHTAQSGKGSGFTAFNGLTYHKLDERTFTVEGTPVDCMQLASMICPEEPDLIVSGCNNGPNVSYDTMYSGTCGACYQGLIFKKKCMAISCAKFVEPTQLENNIDEVLKFVFDNNLLSTKYFLNINLPFAKYDKIKGFKVVNLYRRQSTYTMDCDNIAKNHWKITHHHGDIDTDDSFDVSANANGYCTISPMRLPNCLEEDMKEVEEKIKCH